MALNLTTLFTRLGKIGKLAYVANGQQATIPTDTDALFDLYDGEDRQALIPQALYEAFQNLPGYATTGMGVFATLAEATLLKAVNDDGQPYGQDTELALKELIRQMTAAAASVKRSTCAATPTALAGNAGNGAIVVTTVRGDGVAQELCVPENLAVRCVADSYSGQAVAGSETFRMYGENATRFGTWGYDWPAGSGVATDLFVVDAQTGPSETGNLLTNGGFENWPLSGLVGWTVDVGAVTQSTSPVYAGAFALSMAGGATLHAISQPLSPAPLAKVAYAVNCWVRVATVPAAGVLTIDLYDPLAAAVVNDDAGTPNSFTRTLSTLVNNTWTNLNGVFRLPKAVPAGVKIRVRISTAMSGGSTLYIDHLAMAAVSDPYRGGPGVAVFGGSVPFAELDGWSVAVTNDRGGASLNGTFQALFDRLFDMRGKRLQLPSNAVPTIADTLITA